MIKTKCDLSSSFKCLCKIVVDGLNRISIATVDVKWPLTKVLVTLISVVEITYE